MNFRNITRALAATALAFALAAIPAAAAEKLSVFAAASLKDALDAANAAWTTETGEEAVATYAGTSALAKQIEEGAPADVFVSADLDWMKKLSDKQLIKPATEVQLLGNSIVLVAPKESTVELKLAKGVDLNAVLGESKLAMANVDAVPAGKYGKAALQSLGAWDGVAAKVAQAENVRAALKLVSTGEAALGVVYLTDAKAETGVKVAGLFPAESHAPIIYPAAVVAASGNAAAGGYLKFLQSPKAQAIFAEKGFTILAPAASN